MKQKNPSLFSAIAARLAKIFKRYPDCRERIVRDVRSSKTLTKGIRIMAENENATNEQTNVGPVQVRSRKGKKGPGQLVVVAVDQSNADEIVIELSKTAAPDVMIYTAPQPETKIITAEDWRKNYAAAEAKAAARRAVLASFSADQLKACPELAKLAEKAGI